MKHSVNERIEGTFSHLVYSPRGDIEGVMLQAGQKAAQLVFDRHDEAGPAAFQALRPGQALVIEAEQAPPSPKGKAGHAVYAFQALLAVDGEAPLQAAAPAGYRGCVSRFNYARHGEVNGIVLDTGDFLHMKPDGYARVKPKIGDTVEAEGEARQLIDGRGRVVEVARLRVLKS